MGLSAPAVPRRRSASSFPIRVSFSLRVFLFFFFFLFVFFPLAIGLLLLLFLLGARGIVLLVDEVVSGRGSAVLAAPVRQGSAVLAALAAPVRQGAPGWARAVLAVGLWLVAPPVPGRGPGAVRAFSRRHPLRGGSSGFAVSVRLLLDGEATLGRAAPAAWPGLKALVQVVLVPADGPGGLECLAGPDPSSKRHPPR
jgi:hypothetical protein